jgi:HEAT repeat protein
MKGLNKLIAKLSLDDSDAAADAYRIADFYRAGADIITLLPLLKHSNSRVVSCAVWIASEVAIGERGRKLFNELSELLYHSDPGIRFHAAMSVANLVTNNDKAAASKLIELSLDPDPAVRGIVLRYLCFISDEVVESLHDCDQWASIRLLLATARKRDIVAGVTSKASQEGQRRFEQQMAMISAARNFGHDDGFLSKLAGLIDSELAQTLSELPKSRVIGRRS